MKREHLVRNQEAFGAFRRMLLTLCFFFVCGAVLGFAFCGMAGKENDLLLREYILQYAAACARNEDATASVLSALGAYLRYPLAVFLFGLTAAGALLVPAVLLLQGFGLTFSAACFVSALGRRGLLLALAAFGVRAILVLPVTLLLSMDSFRSSLCMLRGGKKKSEKKPGVHTGRYVRFLVCLILLLLGTAAELLVIPQLLRLALAGLS